ncbi:hypothetical protein [Fischerella sp. JS2]|uniref:hypothetical protein n=1 Tax=Fischerella sp. JS2 TaxID=2597771 RepID=UPI0028E789F5|nr:hypothetical protein [Fischerella sp. JS2]
MSYVSILKTIPEIISQPTGIAVLASVGIHGVIALFLPWMQLETKPKEIKSPKTAVGLVELNQADQNRLPQTTTSGLPKQPGIPLQAQLPQAGQVPVQAQVPPFPNFAFKSTPLPTQPPTTSLVEPPLTSVPLSPNRLRILPLPQKNQLQVAQKQNFQLQPKYDVSQNDTTTIPRVNDRKVTRLQDEIGLGKPQPLPSSVNTSNSVYPTNLPDLQAANIPSNLPNTPTSISSNNPNTPPGLPNQEFVAPSGTPQPGDNLAMGGTSLPQWQPQQPTPQKPELTPPAPTTSQVTAQQIAKITSLNDQLRKVRDQYPNIETKKLISETVSGQRGQQGEIEGGLVYTDGKVDSIEFLDNSVSSSLKVAAREYFRDYFQKNPVQANGKPQYYPFRLSFLPNSNITPAAATPPKLPALVPQKLPILETSKTQSSPSGQQNLQQRLRSLSQNQQLPQQQQPIQTTVKPTTSPAQVGTNQAQSTPQASQLQVNNTQKPNKKLLQQLRQVKQQRQNSNQ